MKSGVTEKPMLFATGAALFFLAVPCLSQASTIPMPAGSRSWILIQSSDCDDDGPNVNIDRSHCTAAVSDLNQAGDLGHGHIPNAYDLYANATIGPETFRGSIQTTGPQFGSVTMTMVDTYTLNSTTLPAGTVVPITVSFHAVGTMMPAFVCCNAYGSGAFDIRVGTSFNPDPIVIPEHARVAGFGPGSSVAIPFLYPRSSADVVPIDLTATGSLDVTIGTPFDLSYMLQAQAIKSTIDFSNTATISFSLPNGTYITSTGGYGSAVPVQAETWSGLKTRHYR